jgi:hypothetical protein
MYSNDNFNGKFWSRVGQKSSDPPGGRVTEAPLYFVI